MWYLWAIEHDHEVADWPEIPGEINYSAYSMTCITTRRESDRARVEHIERENCSLQCSTKYILRAPTCIFTE